MLNHYCAIIFAINCNELNMYLHENIGKNDHFETYLMNLVL